MLAEINLDSVLNLIITAAVTALVTHTINWIRSRPATLLNKLLATAIEVGGDAITKAFVKTNGTLATDKALEPALDHAREVKKQIPVATLREFKSAVRADQARKEALQS